MSITDDDSDAGSPRAFVGDFLTMSLTAALAVSTCVCTYVCVCVCIDIDIYIYVLDSGAGRIHVRLHLAPRQGDAAQRVKQLLHSRVAGQRLPCVCVYVCVCVSLSLSLQLTHSLSLSLSLCARDHPYVHACTRTSHACMFMHACSCMHAMYACMHVHALSARAQASDRTVVTVTYVRTSTPRKLERTSTPWHVKNVGMHASIHACIHPYTRAQTHTHSATKVLRRRPNPSTRQFQAVWRTT